MSGYMNKLKNFITLEGMDGCGKTTITQKLVEHLKNNGYDVVFTREPGGTELGEKLREIVKHSDMSLSTEILLMNSIRMEHLHKVILPALNEGKVVVCDRYVDSTFVYQIYAAEKERIMEESIFNNENEEVLRRELGFKTMDLIHQFKIPYPEKTLFLDVSVETSLSRRNSRNEKTDKFENKDYEDLERIRNAYLKIANEDRILKNNRIVTIDANVPLEEVIKSTLEKIDEFYPKIEKKQTCSLKYK